MLPAIDLASLFIANAVVSGVSAVVLAVIRRNQPDIRGIGNWAAGQGFYASGFLLLYVSMADAFQRSALPGFFLCFSGALLTSLGFHRFLGLGHRAVRAAIIAFTLAVAGLSGLSMTNQSGLVIAGTVATMGSTAALNAWLLYRYGTGQLRPAARTLALQHGVWALYAITRLIFIAVNGFTRPSAVSTLAPAMLLATLMLTCHALGLVWLVVGRLQESLIQQAATDPLTGALNRRALQTRLEQERARAQRDGTGFALVTFDLDHFKQLNDTHGHIVGDMTLIGVVEVARGLLRDTDAVARLGGEEFCLLFPGVTGPDAMAMAERVRTALTALVIDSPSGPVNVAASFGVAWYGDHGHDWPNLLKAADSALYSAKRSGRNRVVAAA